MSRRRRLHAWRHGPLFVSLNLVCPTAIDAVQPDLSEAVTWAFSFNLVSQRRIGLSQGDRANFGETGQMPARS